MHKFSTIGAYLLVRNGKIGLKGHQNPRFILGSPVTWGTVLLL
jgi:hypothetical protein